MNLIEKESDLRIQTLCVEKIILRSCILMAMCTISIWLGNKLSLTDLWRSIHNSFKELVTDTSYKALNYD